MIYSLIAIGFELVPVGLVVATYWRPSRKRKVLRQRATTSLVVASGVCVVLFTFLIVQILTVADGITAWCSVPPDPTLCPEFQHQQTDLNIDFGVLAAIIVCNIGIMVAIVAHRHVLPHVRRLWAR
jgi:hypothetical protein